MERATCEFRVAVAIVGFGRAASVAGGLDVKQMAAHAQPGLTQAIAEQPIVTDAL